MCGDRFFRCANIIAIAMISGDDKLVIIFVAERNNISYDTIKLFDGFDDCVHLAGVTYHISVSEINDDEVEIFGFRDELVVDLLCGHLRI